MTAPIAPPGAPDRSGRPRVKVVAAVLAAIVAVAVAAPLLTGFPTPGDLDDGATTVPVLPSGGPALAAYVAPVNAGGITGLVKFGEAVGEPVTFATAYVDSRGEWATLAEPAWLLDPWARWLDADRSRRLILSVPMLLERDAGRFEDTSHDSAFVGLAQAIEDRGIADRVIIRLGYEMNGDWGPYGRNHDPDGSGFRDMWRRVVPKMKAVHPFLFDWCVVPAADPAGPGFAEAFYPGDDVVDIVGLDVYDHWLTGSLDERWRQLVPALDWAASFADEHDKRLTLDEFAVWSPANSQGGGDNPTYVTNLLTWASDNDLAWISYFNSTAGQVETTLEANPASLEAFRRHLAAD